MGRRCNLTWTKYASMQPYGGRRAPHYEYEAGTATHEFRIVPGTSTGTRGYQLWCARRRGQYRIVGDFKTPQAAKAAACKRRRG